MFTLSFATAGVIRVSLTADGKQKFSIVLRNVASVSPVEVSIEDAGPYVVVNMKGGGPHILFIDQIDSPVYADAAALATAINDAIAAISSGTGGPPTGNAGGVLSGTYPNPAFAIPPVVYADLALRFTFSTTTSDADPGNARFRFNNATIGSVTQMFIDLNDSDNVDVSALLDAMTGGGTLIIHTLGAVSGATCAFRLGAWTTASGYRKFALTYIMGSLPINGQLCQLQLIPNNTINAATQTALDLKQDKIIARTTLGSNANIAASDRIVYLNGNELTENVAVATDRILTLVGAGIFHAATDVDGDGGDLNLDTGTKVTIQSSGSGNWTSIG